MLRERQRLLDAARMAAPAEPLPYSAGPLRPPAETRVSSEKSLPHPAEPGPPAAEPTPHPAEPPAADAPPPSPAEAPSDALDEVAVIQTAPLDDFFFADAAPAGDPDGFDPEGFDPDSFNPDGFDPDSFDFSAFDLGDDADWAEPPGDAPASPPLAADLPTASLSEFGLDETREADPAPEPVTLPDWSERPDDAGVRLVLPDDEAPPAAAPAAPEPDTAWAVFEDLPPASAVLDQPVSDLLAPEALSPSAPPPDDLLGDDAWTNGAWADAAWPATAWSALTSPAGSAAETPPATAPGPATRADVQPPPPGRDEPEEGAAPPSASVFSEPAGSVADELDSLIASLETAPRIRPDSQFSGPAVRVSTADVDQMASETLARIYAAQHQYVQAALVYETLAAREPERAEALLGQAAEMRRRRA